MIDDDYSDKYTESDMIEKCSYIKEKMDEMNNTECRHILQMVINSGISVNKIQTKGTGSQIRFNDLPHSCIDAIAKYIEKSIACKINELKKYVLE